MSMKNFFECQVAVNVLINFPTKLGPTYSGNMGHDNEFNLLSTNVRGIRTFEKRKARDIENIWRKQWKGEVFFSHCGNHSRGTGKG